MKITREDAQDISIVFWWLIVAIVCIVVLKHSDSMVLALEPLTSFVLSDAGIFSEWNRSAPFDSAPARTLTAIYLLLVPFQITSLFLFSKLESSCQKVETKKIAKTALLMGIFALAPVVVSVLGLSVSGPLKIFGTNTSWGAAAAICFITMSISYFVRMIPILLAMCNKNRKSVEAN